MSGRPSDSLPGGTDPRHHGLADKAAAVLRGNDMGSMTTAAPALYPHMWSWDAAFITIGLAAVSVGRAIMEMETLLAAQWRNGMIPHIVFSPDSTTYFPGADRWESSRLAAQAPAHVETSGICQPPVHALAVHRILDAAERGTDDDRAQASRFLDSAWPRLLAWHQWLVTARDPERVGRITIHHGWESGMDNSPRWDGPYSRVEVGADLPAYTRLDQQFVDDGDQRPTDDDYDRYLWLVEEMRRARYDDTVVRKVSGMAVEDVFFTALLSAASEVLADIGRRHRKPAAEVNRLLNWAQHFRDGVVAAVDPVTGMACDRDLRTGEWISAQTVAGFAPLLCGGGSDQSQRRLLDLFNSDSWCGHPAFAAALPPSTSPAAEQFHPRTYWRGPQWPVVAWLFGWAFERNGWAVEATTLRTAALELLADGDFGEYYEPFTGQALGSRQQSWTAAVALDWLRSR